MTPEQKQLIKEKISEILIKWSMPTRQVAINEIVQEFDLAIKQTEERIVEIIKNYSTTVNFDEWDVKEIITLIRNK